MSNTAMKQHWDIVPFLPDLAAVIEHESFSKAAVALNKTQPGVTYAINKLEQAFGVALLHRESHPRVHRIPKLTDDGERVLQTVNKITTLLEALSNDFAD